MYNEIMNNYSSYIAGFAAVFAVPFVASAQPAGENIEELLRAVLDILDMVILIILALALIFFLWGLAKFILNAGDAEAQSQGKKTIFWGLIALFVMVSVWGLVQFIGTTLGIESVEGPPDPPRVPER